MLLIELMPDTTDALDPMAIATDTDMAGIEAPTGRPRMMRDKNANGPNRQKARRIAKFQRTKARAANPESHERAHQSALGGHNGLNWR